MPVTHVQGYSPESQVLMPQLMAFCLFVCLFVCLFIFVIIFAFVVVAFIFFSFLGDGR